MSRGKLRKPRKKSTNHTKEDQSHILECVEEECEESDADSDRLEQKRSKGSRKSAKTVHIAVLPDRYQPLEEDKTDTGKEERELDKRKKYKKIRKNVGKALRYSWKCLVAGLQSFSSAYSGPLGAAATLVPDIQRTRSST